MGAPRPGWSHESQTSAVQFRNSDKKKKVLGMNGYHVRESGGSSKVASSFQ